MAKGWKEVTHKYSGGYPIAWQEDENAGPGAIVIAQNIIGCKKYPMRTLRLNKADRVAVARALVEGLGFAVVKESAEVTLSKMLGCELRSAFYQSVLEQVDRVRELEDE